MARIRQSSSRQRERPSTALTLVGAVLGAATFGFVAAGVWYQYCLAQGGSEAAAAFADLAPPFAVILLAGLGLVVTIGIQVQILREAACVNEESPQSQATPGTETDVRSRAAPLIGVSDEPVCGSPARSELATS